ncbi:Dimeric alpha-beta barrel [Niveomyces insectorum RCEF 264]|uniref:Dimeric alpha-beta barrel n=1 Tax=Niveomyces insectorum RCEF 264 TaxID=1081102 RepID=A0A167YWV3_9HYPO|nr:Dimeric alpha-beta barrel [Niveomyces insectorum RCEF 264]
MTRRFIFARIPAAGEAGRVEVLKSLLPITKYARDSEPGISKYAALVARDDPSDFGVYMIEEYADSAAFDAHGTTDDVKKFVAWLSSPANQPTVHFCEHTQFEHVSPAAGNLQQQRQQQQQQQADAHIVVSEFEFPAEQAGGDALAQFAQPFAAATRPGSGNLLFGVYRDEADVDVILTAEAYSRKDQRPGLTVAGGRLQKETVLQLKYGYLRK